MSEQIFASPNRRFVLRCALSMLLVGLLALCTPMSSTLAQNSENYDAERKRAVQLYNEGNWAEALPLFEKLAAANPSDIQVIEALGFLVIANSKHLKDAEARRKERVRGRGFLARAKDAGAHDPLLLAMLEDVPPDGGSDLVYSSRKEVDEAMLEGEAAFARRDYTKALAAYQRALQFDPQQYDAALYIGDVYYKLDDSDKAGEWYARAISINPDRETAYRYWGDVLMKQGKMTEARDKFVQAYINDPYNRLTAAGLVQWADKNKVTLAHPKIDIPSNVSSSKPGEVTINIDPLTLGKGSDETGSSAWMMYGIARALWMPGKDGKMGEKFAKQFPGEKTYRHSLAEEMDALSLVITSLKEQMKDKKPKRLDPSLANLLKLSDAGLLEAYILLARADQGIAHDYAAYRKANPDKLRRYVFEYVLTGGGQ